MKRSELRQIIKEEIQRLNEGAIADKDWQRMLDLVSARKDGEAVAAKLKNKTKAIARFVTGLKLMGQELSFDGKKYKKDKKANWKDSDFSDFGNKALELGATSQEIEQVFKSTKVPSKYSEKKDSQKDSKLDNTFVAAISKVILKLGHKIKFLPHNGNALTPDGMDAMRKNGSNWTIGYKTEIDANGKKIKFAFDAITDEGFRRPTKYVLDRRNSDSEFGDEMKWGEMGVKEFVKGIKDTLDKESK